MNRLLLTRSYSWLRFSLKARRVLRRALASQSEDRQRLLHLGRAPGPSHPLRFLWAMDVCHLNSWSLHGESILFLWDVLIERRPRDILELGTGWSSLMFGKYAQHILQNHAVLVSVASAEHDSTWAVHTTEMLETHGLGRFVQIYTDPLQMLEIDGANGPGYDLSALGEQDFDFVLIDGPPGNLGRELTLPLILPRVRRRALIFLDDAQRPMEQAAISKWRLEYESRLAFRGFVPVGNGLGCFERI